MALSTSKGVVFSEAAASRIADAVRKVESQPSSPVSSSRPATNEGSFWAMIENCNIDASRFSFVRVYPDNSTSSVPGGGTPDILVGKQRWKMVTTGNELDYSHYSAFEANGSKQVPRGTIVKMDFAGYDADSQPLFAFQYTAPAAEQYEVPIHDHRDNLDGGFALGTYHPGTGLPQQKWAL